MKVALCKMYMDDEIKKVMQKYGSTGIQETLNKVVFEIMQYIAVFPASSTKLTDSKGNVLPDCFLMPSGSTALDFAFKIHTDLGNKFIKAIDVKRKMMQCNKLFIYIFPWLINLNVI
jgi:ribosome-binding ATPase YchF (GTP1/OBG family)